MKQKLTKLNELQATLLLSGIISIILILLSLIGLIFNQPGWIIGVSIGSLSSFLNVWLTNIGGDVVLKKQKPILFILFYFVRILIFVGLFAFLVVMQYNAHVGAFTNAFWGYMIGFAPSAFITIASQLLFVKES